jgi:hypothetical protein
MRIVWNKVTWYSILLAVAVFVATLLVGAYIGIVYQKYVFEKREVTRIKKCPTEWYEDRMPTIVEDLNQVPDKQLFIIGGQKYNSHQVDIEWIRSHCEIKPVILG